jgi:hypothetical protein
MGRDETNPGGWGSYDESFREDAHQLLAWGYEGSRHRLTSSLEETEITGFIVEAIEARLNAPETDERFDRYCVKEDSPVPGEGRTGKRRRRMDITVECTYRPRHKPRPRYILEAKRLRRPSHLIGYYAGEEGVKRFVSGLYASDCPEVAMVGYVQSDAAGYWMGRLEELFDDDSADEYRVRGRLSRKKIIIDLPDEWGSGHLRSNGALIMIYHILLDCNAAVSAP